MNDDKYSLLVSFDDQSASYAHGFEAGKIWAAHCGLGVEQENGGVLVVFKRSWMGVEFV